MTNPVFFALTLLVILGLCATYLGFWLTRRFAPAKRHPWRVALAFLAFLLLSISTLLLMRAELTVWPGRRLFFLTSYLSLGVFGCWMIYAAAVDLLTLLLRAGFYLSGRPLSAPTLHRRTFVAVLVLTLSSALLGSLQVAQGPNLDEVEIPLANLPPEFDGFKIAQVSDLHVGPTIDRAYTEKVVAMVNEAAPDLIALTGDFVDGSVAQLREGVEPLADLKAPHGVFFVTGNHEYYSGAEAWVEEFRRLGATVLMNQHEILRKEHAQIVLAGVTDYKAASILPHHKSDPFKAIEGAPATTRILLAHQPTSYVEAVKAGFDLQLSGHTHGGQYFPWSLAVQLAHRYYKGLNKHENMWIYINRGIGYWGPPLRFTVPAEITLLRLKRAPVL